MFVYSSCLILELLGFCLDIGAFYHVLLCYYHLHYDKLFFVLQQMRTGFLWGLLVPIFMNIYVQEGG